MHCISPPTKPKVPLNSLRTPEIGQRLPRGRQVMAGGLWATVWDCGYFGSVAKAMALANPNARLGGKGNALHFPAHKTQSAAELPQHSRNRPSPAWAGEDRLPRGRQAMAGGFGHRLGLLMLGLSGQGGGLGQT